MKDNISTHIVENIVAHSGTKTHPGRMDFKVRWRGLDATRDLWLPYKELRLNTVLHEYLLANGMKRIIPKECRVGQFK